MAKKSGFDFSGIIDGIEKEIAGVLADNGIREMAQEFFASSTKETVYWYHPTMYKQRGAHGGLADPKNYEVKSEGLTMTITNNTESNENQPNPSGGYINDIIESGQGYEWVKSEMYQMEYARPFMSDAADQFAEYLLSMIDLTVFGDSN